MITLITGAPGTGKTALTVDLLLTLGTERPLFVMGINDLKIDHNPVPPVDQWTELRPSAEDPSVLVAHFTFPPNSIVVIDECQKVFRPRTQNSKVPDYIAAFETHRHQGIDFILITQNPKLLDSNIKSLIHKHFHLKLHFLGTTKFHWVGEVGVVDSRASRSDAIRENYKPPKRVFALYKSAEVHTSKKVPLHPAFKMLILLIPVLIYGLYHVYNMMSSRMGLKPVEDGVQATKERGAIPEQARPPSPKSSEPEKRFFDPADFAPRYPNHPESAPAFEGLRSVSTFPKVSACIASQSRCLCYTQQATRLEIEEAVCRRIARDGYFDPYQQQPSSLPVSASAVTLSKDNS